MPAKKKPQSTNTNTREASFKGFINYTPSEEDKDACNSLRQSNDIVGSTLSRVLEGGYKLSCVYVEKNACYSATLFCKDTSNAFAGWCLSMRAGDPITAVERVLWLHYYHLREDWSNAVEDGGEADVW